MTMIKSEFKLNKIFSNCSFDAIHTAFRLDACKNVKKKLNVKFVYSGRPIYMSYKL